MTVKDYLLLLGSKGLVQEAVLRQNENAWKGIKALSDAKNLNDLLKVRSNNIELLLW
jgi:hypothetical protein